jgi:hypothetical protein
LGPNQKTIIIPATELSQRLMRVVEGGVILPEIIIGKPFLHVPTLPVSPALNTSQTYWPQCIQIQDQYAIDKTCGLMDGAE